jgi:hypothetical protein
MGSEDGSTGGTQRQIHVDGSGNLQTNVVNTVNVAPANSANSHITDDPANSVAVGLKARQTIGTATTETFLKCSATGELQTSDTGTQSGLTAINNNALSIASTNVSIDTKLTTTNGHLNNIENQTSGLATESTLGDIDTKLVLPSALSTSTGSLKVSIEESSAGGDASASNQVTANGHLSTIAGDTTSVDSKITQGYDAQVASGGSGLQQVLLYGRDYGSGNLDAVKVTANGDVEVEIADMVKGNTTASASFPVTDSSKKVKDVSWMTSETISNQTLSTSILDCEGYARVMIYGEMTTAGSGNNIKIHGSNTSGGTYYHCGQLTVNTTQTGKYYLLEDIPQTHANGPRYLKVFNGTGGTISGVTLRAVMSEFMEYQ